MKGGIGQLMKQAQQMQADMKKAQEDISAMALPPGPVRVETAGHLPSLFRIDGRCTWSAV